LRRLACPYFKAQTDPAQPDYNPYITVDYMNNVPTNQHVITKGTNFVDFKTTPCFSIGRRQPYSALWTNDANTQLVLQQPNTNAGQTNGSPVLYTTSPQHTFFQHNAVEGVAGAAPNSPASGPNN